MGEKYDEKIDIWALGAMAFELFTGNNPFNITTKV
jgi:serine/threonine protein kinase